MQKNMSCIVQFTHVWIPSSEASHMHQISFCDTSKKIDEFQFRMTLNG